jgi:hypothetical protein
MWPSSSGYEPWRDVLLARFAGVVRRPGAPKVSDFTNSHGPLCAWLRKYIVRSFTYHFFIVSVCNHLLIFEFFQATFMRDDIDKQMRTGTWRRTCCGSSVT